MTSIKKSTTYVLLSIVLLTSVAAVAANLGLFGFDPNSNFAKVTLASVLVEIVGAFVFLAKQTYNDQPTTLTAAIKFPPTVDANHLSILRWDHANCVYEVMDAQANVKRRGQMTLVLGNGGWECKIQSPDDVDDSIELKLVEEDGTTWEVPRFYPLARTVNAIERHRVDVHLPKISVDQETPEEELAAKQSTDKKSPEKIAPIQVVKFNNVAKLARAGAGHSWYDWVVFVDENKNVLDKIESVDYLLHRTFPNPLRNSSDAKNQFPCKSNGWGTFTIFITIHFKDNTELQTSYDLSFSKPWSKKFDLL